MGERMNGLQKTATRRRPVRLGNGLDGGTCARRGLTVTQMPMDDDVEEASPGIWDGAIMRRCIWHRPPNSVGGPGWR